MKKVFRFFRSMRFGMILLILIMLLSLAGSLVPQQAETMRYVRAFGSRPAMLIVALGLDDVFHTPLFYALEGLLCLNLTLCSILRFPRARGAFDELKRGAAQPGGETPASKETLEEIERLLSSRRFKREEAGGARLYSKNGLGRYGSFLTHLSILLVLLFGSLVLMTPTVTDETVMPGEALTLGDGTRVECLSFHIENEAGDLDYASRLRVLSPDGAREKEQEIRVNEPLRFGGYKIYQQTYGTAGQVTIVNRASGASETFPLTDPAFLSIDGENGVYFQALYPGFVREADGSVTLVTNTAGGYADPVYSVQSISGGMSTSVLAFPGETLTLGEIDFTFREPVEYPGLRIKRVSPALYAGLYFSFALMVIALYLCFFMAPVAVRVEDAGWRVDSPKSQQGLELALRQISDREVKP